MPGPRAPAVLLAGLLCAQLPCFAAVSAGGGSVGAPGIRSRSSAPAREGKQTPSGAGGAALGGGTDRGEGSGLILRLRGGKEALNFRRISFHWPVGDVHHNKVELVGSWSGWTTICEMYKQADGSFDLDLELPLGKHTYKFILDGGEWTFSERDLIDIDERGNKNNIVLTDERTPHPVLGVFRKVKFQWKKSDPLPKKVEVVGSWSGWHLIYALDEKDDVFEALLDLPMGKHVYKFIIDGTQWTHSEEDVIDIDERGNRNNMVLVDEDTANADLTTLSAHDQEQEDFKHLEGSGTGLSFRNAFSSLLSSAPKDDRKRENEWKKQEEELRKEKELEEKKRRDEAERKQKEEEEQKQKEDEEKAAESRRQADALIHEAEEAAKQKMEEKKAEVSKKAPATPVGKKAGAKAAEKDVLLHKVTPQTAALGKKVESKANKPAERKADAPSRKKGFLGLF